MKKITMILTADAVDQLKKCSQMRKTDCHAPLTDAELSLIFLLETALEKNYDGISIGTESEYEQSIN